MGPAEYLIESAGGGSGINRLTKYKAYIIENYIP